MWVVCKVYKEIFMFCVYFGLIKGEFFGGIWWVFLKGFLGGVNV